MLSRKKQTDSANIFHELCLEGKELKINQCSAPTLASSSSVFSASDFIRLMVLTYFSSKFFSRSVNSSSSSNTSSTRDSVDWRDNVRVKLYSGVIFYLVKVVSVEIFKLIVLSSCTVLLNIPDVLVTVMTLQMLIIEFSLNNFIQFNDKKVLI